MIEQVLIRMPKELKKEIVALAKSWGLTVNAVILQDLWQLVRENKKKEEDI